jgi:hypothetical protein
VTGAPNPPPGVLDSFFRVIGIVLIFALVGPPIGGVTLITTMAVVNMGSATTTSDYVTVVLFGLIYGAVFAYLVGLLPAAVVGLIVAIRQVYFGRVTWLAALGLGSIAGLIFIYVVERAPAYDRSYPASVRPILVVTCLLPTVACWLIVRNWYRKPQAAPA